ncbi:hypothetical protein ACOJR9_11915 [Alteromonas sp. A081]|uniref:hypothetical protein n=1 Tax=Alteromonas sp. A081 TaxID=3410269 RepID=UPI003B9826D5
MTTSTCKVWGCSRPIDNAKYGKHCKRHREANLHNGHPTFKPPALCKRYASYNQELTKAFQGGKQWYSEADLTHYEKAFGRLLDEAEKLKALSPYRRLGDLPVRSQLLYLLKASVEAVGRHVTKKQWLCIYLAARFKKDLFPNRKTLAIFVCRKSLVRLINMPQHITRTGKKRRYRLNANRALKMLDILEPIFELSHVPINNVALWFRHYTYKLHLSNIQKRVMREKHEKNPFHAKQLNRIKTIKSLERKYLGG